MATHDPDPSRNTPPPAVRTVALHRLRLGIAALCVVILAIVWSATGAILYDLHERAIEQARIDATNLTNVSAAFLKTRIGTIDRALRRLKRQYEQDPESFLASGELSMVQLEPGELAAALIVGADGTVMASNRGKPNPPLNVRDPAISRQLAAAPTDRLIIADPVIGPFSGKQVIRFARRLDNPDGSYAGSVVLSVFIDELSRFFASLDLGQTGEMLVVRDDLTVLLAVSRSTPSAPIGGSMRGHLLEKELAKSPQGTYQTTGKRAGVRRVLHYHPVDGYGLTVAGGDGLDERLAATRRQANQLIALSAMVSGLLIGAALVLIRELGRKDSALRQVVLANHRFSAAIEALPLPFIALDRDDRVTVWNPAAEREFGYSAAEVVRQPYPLVPSGMAAERQRQRREFWRNEGATTAIETQRRRKDGSEVDVLLHAATIGDGTGTPSEAFVLMENISARLEATRELQASEAHAHGLLEASPDAIIVVDESGRIVQANPRVREVLGWPPEDLVGQHVEVLIDVPDRVAYMRLFQTHAAAPGARRMTASPRLRTMRRDGSVFASEINLGPYSDGSRSLVVATIRDVTERRQAEMEIRRWYEAFRQSDVAILLSEGERESARRFANPAYLRLMRIDSVEALSNQPYEDFYVPEERDRVRELMNISEAEGHVGFEATVQRPGGSCFPALLSITVVPASGDRPRRRVSTVIDLTHLRQVEDQLRQSQKMETLGMFAGGIAHDFNNILTPILGNVEFMQMHPDLPAAEREDILKDVGQSAASAARLTAQLLAFARRQPLTAESVSARQVVTERASLIQRMLGRKIEVVVRAEDEPYPVCIDVSQFENALFNLAVNARDAMPKGGTLTIGLNTTVLEDSYVRGHVGAKSGVHVMVSVTDTGTGMDADTLRQAFEPFFTTKPRGKGTGLGLAQVFSFARQSGGHVELASTPGSGTTVTIYLPHDPKAAEDPVPQAQPTTASYFAPATILVVDDQEAVRAFAARTLRRDGYEVLMAGSAEEAMDLLTSGADIALLVIDIVMPGTNGYELAAQATRHLSDLKVVLITGDPAFFTRVENRFVTLTKPFTGIQLRDKVRQALDDTSAGAYTTA